MNNIEAIWSTQVDYGLQIYKDVSQRSYELQNNILAILNIFVH